MTAPAVLRQDPRSTATQADLDAQLELLLGANRKLSEVHTQIERIREVRSQLDALRKRVGGDERGKEIVASAKALDAKITAIEQALYQTRNRSPQDPLNFPIRLNDKLASVAESAATGDFAPTAQQRAVYAQLVASIDAELAKLNAIWQNELPALNEVVRQAAIPAVQ